MPRATCLTQVEAQRGVSNLQIKTAQVNATLIHSDGFSRFPVIITVWFSCKLLANEKARPQMGFRSATFSLSQLICHLKQVTSTLVLIPSL